MKVYALLDEFMCEEPCCMGIFTTLDKAREVQQKHKKHQLELLAERTGIYSNGHFTYRPDAFRIHELELDAEIYALSDCLIVT